MRSTPLGCLPSGFYLHAASGDEQVEQIRLRPIADAAGMSLAQLAIAWVLQKPHVGATIIGASRPDQVRHYAAAAGRKLTGDVLAEIDAALVDDVHGDLVERDSHKVADPVHIKPSWR